ncbi:MAG: bacteriophage T4 gp5 trimerization domain-containing protein [Flavobacteriales bacterium]
MNINVGENMTTTVGMNKSDSIGMNNTESVGAMKMTSVVGDASMFITGKLTEMIEGDVHSETKKERKEYASEVENSSTEGKLHQNAKDQVENNSGEKSNNF